MLRLIAFLIAIALIAAGLAWLADRPGELVIQWQGYQIETSVFRAIVMLVALVAVALALLVDPAQHLVQPRGRRQCAQQAPAEARHRRAVERHDRARRRRQGSRHARRHPGAQVAAQRAADASVARAGRAAHRRPHHGAPHLRSDAGLARHRAARPARPLPRSAARARDGGRAPLRRARRRPQPEARRGRSMRCSTCSAATAIGRRAWRLSPSPARTATSSAHRPIAAAPCCSRRRRRPPRKAIRNAP